MPVDNNFYGILIFVGLMFGAFIIKLNDSKKYNQSYEILQSEQLEIISNIYNLFFVAKNRDTWLQPTVFEDKKSINATKILILANPRYTKATNRKIRKTEFIYICGSKNGSSSSAVNTG